MKLSRKPKAVAKMELKKPEIRTRGRAASTTSWRLSFGNVNVPILFVSYIGKCVLIFHILQT